MYHKHQGKRCTSLNCDMRLCRQSSSKSSASVTSSSVSRAEHESRSRDSSSDPDPRLMIIRTPDVFFGLPGRPLCFLPPALPPVPLPPAPPLLPQNPLLLAPLLLLRPLLPSEDVGDIPPSALWLRWECWEVRLSSSMSDMLATGVSTLGALCLRPLWDEDGVEDPSVWSDSPPPRAWWWCGSLASSLSLSLSSSAMEKRPDDMDMVMLTERRATDDSAHIVWLTRRGPGQKSKTWVRIWDLCFRSDHVGNKKLFSFSEHDTRCWTWKWEFTLRTACSLLTNCFRKKSLTKILSMEVVQDWKEHCSTVNICKIGFHRIADEFACKSIKFSWERPRTWDNIKRPGGLSCLHFAFYEKSEPRWRLQAPHGTNLFPNVSRFLSCASVELRLASSPTIIQLCETHATRNRQKSNFDRKMYRHLHRLRCAAVVADVVVRPAKPRALDRHRFSSQSVRSGVLPCGKSLFLVQVFFSDLSGQLEILRFVASGKGSGELFKLAFGRCVAGTLDSFKEGWSCAWSEWQRPSFLCGCQTLGRASAFSMVMYSIQVHMVIWGQRVSAGLEKLHREDVLRGSSQGNLNLFFSSFRGSSKFPKVARGLSPVISLSWIFSKSQFLSQLRLSLNPSCSFHMLSFILESRFLTWVHGKMKTNKLRSIYERSNQKPSGCMVGAATVIKTFLIKTFLLFSSSFFERSVASPRFFSVHVRAQINAITTWRQHQKEKRK